MERVTVNVGERPVGDGPAVDPSTLRKYMMPPIMDFSDSRQKRQHDN